MGPSSISSIALAPGALSIVLNESTGGSTTSDYINLANQSDFHLKGSCTQAPFNQRTEGHSVFIRATSPGLSDVDVGSAPCLNGTFDVLIDTAESVSINQGPVSFTASMTNAVHETADSDAFNSVTKDTIAPVAPSTFVMKTPSSPIGNLASAVLSASVPSFTLDGSMVSVYTGDHACTTLRGSTPLSSTDADITLGTPSSSVPLPDGAYEFYVRTEDAAGNHSGCSSIQNLSFSYTLDTALPRVLSVGTSSSNGHYSTGSVIDIRVKFSEPVLVDASSGTPRIALNTQPVMRYADYLSGNASDTLTFRYTVLLGDTSTKLEVPGTGALSLNGGTIQDPATNSAVLTLPAPGSALSLSGQKSLEISLADHLTIEGGYTSQISGQVFSLLIHAKDSNDADIPTFQGALQLQLSGSRDPGFLSTTPNSTASCTFSSADQGVKSCPITLNQTGSTWVITATFGGVTVTSDPITVAPGAVSTLSFSTQPAPVNLVAGNLLTTSPKVSAYDAQGNLKTDLAPGAVTLAADSGACSGAASVVSGGISQGTSSVSSGVTSFSSVTAIKTRTLKLQAYTQGFAQKICSSSVTILPATTSRISYVKEDGTNTAPTSIAVAGTAFSPQPLITAFDAYDNVVTTSTATITMKGYSTINSCSDSALDGIPDSNSGSGITSDALIGGFPARTLSSGITPAFGNLKPLKTSVHYLVASDSNGHYACSSSFTVNPAPVNKLQISSLSSSAVAGVPLSFLVTALDAYGNVVPNYSGTVAITSTDSQASLPSSSTLTNGLGTFSATLKTAGSKTFTASDGGRSITSSAVTVSPAAASQLVITGAPGSSVAGASSSLTVTAKDPYGNTATSYAGSVSFSSTDPAATLPASSMLVSGQKSFNFTLKTTGSRTVSLTDGTFSATSSSISVTAGAYSIAQSTVTLSNASVAAGSQITATLTVLDAYGNASPTGLPALSGISFTASAVGGTGTFGTISTSSTGVYTASFTGTIAGSAVIGATISGVAAQTTASVTVTPGPATQVSLSSVPISATAGSPFSVGVTAKDYYGNTATTFAGSVSFTSTDSAATLPASSTLVNGVGSFSVTLKTAGSKTITASGGSFSVTSSAIPVGAASPSQFLWTTPASTIAGTSFSVTLASFDAYGNACTNFTGTATFSSTDSAAVLPSPVALVAGTKTVSVILKTAGSKTITATSGQVSGTSSGITVNPGAIASLSFGSPGAQPTPTVNYTTLPFNAGTPAVAAYDAYGNLATNSTSTITLEAYTSASGTCGTPIVAGLTGDVDALTQAINSGTGVASFSNVIARKTTVKRLRASLTVGGSLITACTGSDLSITVIAPRFQFSDSSGSSRTGFAVKAASCTGLNAPVAGCVSSSTKVPLGTPITITRKYLDLATNTYLTYAPPATSSTVTLRLTPVTATAGAQNGATMLTPSASGGSASSTNYYTPAYTASSPYWTTTVVIPANQYSVVVDTATLGIPNLTTSLCTSGSIAPCNADTFFTYTITAVDNGDIGTASRAQVMIVDPTYTLSSYDGGGDVQLSHSFYSADGGNNAEVVVQRVFGASSSTGDTTGTEVVDLSILRGLGTDGNQYSTSGVSSVVSFAANEVEKTITIPTLSAASNSSFFVQVQPHSITGNLVRGSTTVSSVASITGISAGQAVKGLGIPSGTTVSSVSGSTLVLSQAASANETQGTLYFGSVRTQSIAKVRILNTSATDVAATATADACKVGATPFGGGYGTASKPYLICDTTQWANLTSTTACDSTATKIGGYAGAGGTSASCRSPSYSFKLMKDLTAPSSFSSGASLQANLDGNEYILYDYRSTATGNPSLLSGSTGSISPSGASTLIQSLNVLYASVTGVSSANNGILINSMSGYGAQLKDVFVSGLLQTSAGSAGLLVGLNDRSGSTASIPIQYSMAAGSLSSSAGNAIGGITGMLSFSTASTSDGAIRNSYSSVNLQASASTQTGGMLGQHSVGSVSTPGLTFDGLRNTGMVYGKTSVGGIVGQYELSIPGSAVTHTLSNSSNSGSVIAAGNATNSLAGGIVGQATCDPGADGAGSPCTNSTLLFDSDLNTGSVHGQNATASFTGGIVGRLTAMNDGTAAISGLNYTIQNTGNIGAIFGAKSYIGGIAGRIYVGSNTSTASNSINLTNAWSSGNVSATTAGGIDMAGGIGDLRFGYAVATVNNSAASGSVDCNGASECGGFLGSIYRVGTPLVGTYSSYSVSSSFASGAVSNAGGSSGGFLGFMGYAGTFTSNSAYGNVSTIGSASINAVGGFVGWISGSYGSTTFSKCSATGDVTSGSGTTLAYSGGFAGQIQGVTSGTTISIQKSWASGNLNVGGSYAGGFCGWANIGAGTTYTTDQCFASGSVTASGNYAGGLFGYASMSGSMSVSNSYSVGTPSSNNGVNTSAKGVFGGRSGVLPVTNVYFVSSPAAESPTGLYQPSQQTSATLQNPGSSVFSGSGFDSNFTGSTWIAPVSGTCSLSSCPGTSYRYPTLAL